MKQARNKVPFIDFSICSEIGLLKYPKKFNHNLFCLFFLFRKLEGSGERGDDHKRERKEG